MTNGDMDVTGNVIAVMPICWEILQTIDKSRCLCCVVVVAVVEIADCIILLLILTSLVFNLFKWSQPTGSSQQPVKIVPTHNKTRAASQYQERERVEEITKLRQSKSYVTRAEN